MTKQKLKAMVGYERQLLKDIFFLQYQHHEHFKDIS